MTLIWATRGYAWGFTFLRDGGVADPLPTYEVCFPADAPEPVPLRRVGDKVAVRLVDPEGRRDRSGRVIVHEFIVDGDLAEQIHTLDDAHRIVWSLVRDDYTAIWNLPGPDQPGK
ncbi:MAG TPA: hypothetical protein VFN21_14030 [Acidimicrobiales bacterium]|nr:hypothetical protein [Acidimicrobiales bacterium]